MTDQEISDFLHGRGRLIDWDQVKARREGGEKQAPWAASGAGA